MCTVFRVLTNGLLVSALTVALAQQAADQPTDVPAVPPMNQPVPAVAPTAPATTDLAPVTNAPALTAPAAPATTTPPTAPAPPPKPKKPAVPVIRGTLSAVDRVEMTITVATKQKDQVYRVTSRTRFSREGKPATLGDGVIGEEIALTARPAKKGVKPELVSVRFGVKSPLSKKPASGGKSKSPSASPSASPVAN